MRLLDLVLPPACAGCGSASGPWCAECGSSLRPASDPGEWFLRADPGVVVGDALEVAIAAYAYEDRLRRALARLKYGATPRVAAPLAEAAARHAKRLLGAIGPATLVPVPVHPDRLKDRGYNQAALLAAELSTRIGQPAAELLVRQRPTEKQHRLNRMARLRNLEGAFAMALARKPPPTVLLVDDILTTSATLEACARVLRAAGCERVGGFAIAREL
jgi:ComF family protein